MTQSPTIRTKQVLHSVSHVRFLFPIVLFLLFVINIPSLRAVQQTTTAGGSESALYQLTFTSTWSQETHPHPGGAERFPGNAHFSSIGGGTHMSGVSFWSLGELASDGIKDVAELGNRTKLEGEVQSAINAGTADQILRGPNLSDSPASRSFEFTVSDTYPLVTLVSMLAPSPDWFVGVSGLSLQNDQGEWINELAIDLAPYDAGTDDGSDYRSSDAVSNPPQLISDLTGVSPFSSETLGTFTFTRLDAPDETPTLTPTNTPPHTPTTTPPPQADLVVTGISIELNDDTCFSETSVLGYRVTIANNGSANAGTFAVELNNSVRQFISGLNAGTSTQLWFAGSGMGEVSAMVDPGNEIAESNETNNTLTTFPPVATPPPSCTATPTMTPTMTSTDVLSSTATPTMTPTAMASATPVPAISIVTPEDGITVTLPFTLEVIVQHWPLQEDGNHYHWMVDGIDQGPVFSATPVSIANLTSGSHLLTVALAKPDHSFINVQDTITINVAPSTSTEEPSTTATFTQTPTTTSTMQPTMTSTATPTITPLAQDQSPSGVDTETAQYQLTFASTWSNVTHPYSGTFPSGAHYSPLIGAIHNEQTRFWSEGGIATDGIEVMAETGGTGPLRNEIQSEIDAGNAHRIVTGGGLGSTPGNLNTQPFTATKSYPLLTLVTMIAPSPDWFVGVHDLSLLDEDDNWRSTLSFDLLPYDAGTDDGPDYTSANANSDPPQPIRNLSGVTPFSNQPLGTFTITRVDTPTNPNLEARIYLSVMFQ
ncbi:MAG: spondin domain-containing protein [Chloroflexota bacterium]